MFIIGVLPPFENVANKFKGSPSRGLLPRPRVVARNDGGLELDKKIKRFINISSYCTNLSYTHETKLVCNASSKLIYNFQY